MSGGGAGGRPGGVVCGRPGALVFVCVGVVCSVGVFVCVSFVCVRVCACDDVVARA